MNNINQATTVTTELHISDVVITESNKRVLNQVITTAVFNEAKLTAKVALSIATIFTTNIEDLISEYAFDWLDSVVTQSKHITINGEAVVVSDIVGILESLGFIEEVGGHYVIGSKAEKVLRRTTGATKPTIVRYVFTCT